MRRRSRARSPTLSSGRCSTFGAQFGNALYGDVAGQPAGGAGDTLAPALRKTLLDLGVSQGFDEERVRQAVRGQTGKDLDDLPASELTPLVERAARKVQQRQDGEAGQNWRRRVQ